MLCCLWDGEYKRHLAANVVMEVGFLSHYLNGRLQYNRIKNMLSALLNKTFPSFPSFLPSVFVVLLIFKYHNWK